MFSSLANCTILWDSKLLQIARSVIHGGHVCVQREFPEIVIGVGRGSGDGIPGLGLALVLGLGLVRVSIRARV